MPEVFLVSNPLNWPDVVIGFLTNLGNAPLMMDGENLSQDTVRGRGVMSFLTDMLYLIIVELGCFCPFGLLLYSLRKRNWKH